MNKKRNFIIIVSIFFIIIGWTFNSIFLKLENEKNNSNLTNEVTILNNQIFVSIKQKLKTSKEDMDNFKKLQINTEETNKVLQSNNEITDKKENIVKNQNSQSNIEKVEEKKKTVTIAIDCITAINNEINKKNGFTHLPMDGKILQAIEVELKEGDTVFDILVKATRQNGVQMEYTGIGSTIYIEGIDNLYEFDGGKDSGWMYSVNDLYPNYGCGIYKVKESDVIKWNYTCDLGRDLGAGRN